MLYVAYIYILNSNLSLNIELNKFFIICLAVFLFFNIILIILHNIYNFESNKNLNKYFVNIKEINFKNKSPFELACLRNSRLPKRRDIITVLLDLINRGYIKIYKYSNKKYYIKKIANDRRKLSESEKNLIDTINDEFYDLKKFISNIFKKNNCKKILNKMTEEIEHKFEEVKINIVFYFLFKILNLFLISFVFIFALGILSFSNIKLNIPIIEYLSEPLSVIIGFMFLIEFFVIASMLYSKIQKLNNILIEKEDLKGFLRINVFVLIFFILIFLLNKCISIFLIITYLYTLSLLLKDKRRFINVKKGYIKDKIEAISLEKYMKEEILINEKECKMIFKEYINCAFSFEIKLKSNENLTSDQIILEKFFKKSKNNLTLFMESVLKL